MIRIVRRLTLLVLLAAAVPTLAVAAETALCRVCAVKEGATEPETVRAWRTHEGTRYGFCSEACAKAFDADPAAYVPASGPTPAPALTATLLDGRAIGWKDYAGKPVLLDFWATWCAPCRKSMPELQALHEKWSARGLVVLGLSIDESKDAAKVKKFVASRKLGYPIAMDAARGPTWERFRVQSVPATFLVDAEGRVVARWLGAAPRPDDVERELQKLFGTMD